MKTKMLTILICFGLALGTGFAQKKDYDNHEKKTAHFKVEGPEGQCGPLDEAIAEGGGILETDYNWINKSMEITYNPDEISLNEIRNRLADVGYEPITEEETAADPMGEIALQCRFEEHPDMEK